MNITLRAKLKAYSKVDIYQQSLPHPSLDDAGKFLGIGMDGNYTLFDNATERQIDDIVNGEPIEKQPSEAARTFIDSLFG